jgi:hypothetical protein
MQAQQQQQLAMAQAYHNMAAAYAQQQKQKELQVGGHSNGGILSSRNSISLKAITNFIGNPICMASSFFSDRCSNSLNMNSNSSNYSNSSRTTGTWIVRDPAVMTEIETGIRTEIEIDEEIEEMTGIETGRLFWR